MKAAAHHADPLVGLDLHLIQPPGPVPPVLIPHPHTGVVFDPIDYLPILGATVRCGGLPRAVGGTTGMILPPHLPIGGVFVAPPANDAEMFMGSSTVRADGEVMCHLAHPALSCSDIGIPSIPRLKIGSKMRSIGLPTTLAMAIPTGVHMGGSPTISLAGIVTRAAIAALRKVARKAKRLFGKKARRQNGRCANGIDPVDLVTGAVFDTFVDAREDLFVWERHYTTERASEAGSLGYGFRHGYDLRLHVGPQGLVLDCPTGPRVAVRPLEVGDDESSNGFRFMRVSSEEYEVRHCDRVMRFASAGVAPSFRLRSVEGASHRLEFAYDEDRLERIELHAEGELRPSSAYRVIYDRANRIDRIERGEGGPARVVAMYEYDVHGDLVRTTDAEGGTFAFRYDEHHRWSERRDPRGYRYRWSYDALGRCTSGGGEDGLWEGYLRYFPERKTTTLRESDGRIWEFHYDDQQTIVAIRDPLGGVRKRSVDDEGRIVADVDSGGRVTRWLYEDDFGVLGRRDRFDRNFDVEEELGDELGPQIPGTPAEWRYGSFATLTPRTDLRRDRLGRPIEEDIAECRRTYERDAAGNVVRWVDGDGGTHERWIVGPDLVGAEIDPLGGTTFYNYTAHELVSRIGDPCGTEHEYRYDAKDRLTEVYRHGRLRDQYCYDSGDRLVEKRGGRGNKRLQFEYGSNNLVSERRFGSGFVQRFAYDPNGRVIEASTTEHRVLLERDQLGRLLCDVRDGRGVVHVYRGAQRAETTFLERFVVRFRSFGDSLQIVDPTGDVHWIDRGSDGEIVRRHANGVIERSEFSSRGRCMRRHLVCGERLEIAQYRYTAEGDLLEVDDSREGKTRYQYDAAHRLVAMESRLGRAAYQYDAAHNLYAKPGLAMTRFMSGNRISFANHEEFDYDERDHIRARKSASGAQRIYRYDELDQLVVVQSTEADEFWVASYDGLGRRARAGYASKQREFVWDDERLAAEIDCAGRLRLYIYADERALSPLLFVDYDSIDADPTSGQVYVLIVDGVGMPEQAIDGQGAVVWAVGERDPYGGISIDPASTIEFNFRWPGHYYDRELGLHYNRFRYYDPMLGRYIQSDPLGTYGGVNLYAYVRNPTSNVDILGLKACGESGNSVGAGASPTPDAERAALVADLGRLLEERHRPLCQSQNEYDRRKVC